MEKYKDSDVELMSILLKLQEQTSPIRMSIGYTVGGTVRQGIILYEAAPKVIETLIEKGYTCDLNGCGMRVYSGIVTVEKTIVRSDDTGAVHMYIYFAGGEKDV